MKRTKNGVDKYLVNSAGLSAALDLSLRTVARMVADGAPHYRYGRSLRFSVDEVLGWLHERQREESTTQRAKSGRPRKELSR